MIYYLEPILKTEKITAVKRILLERIDWNKRQGAVDPDGLRSESVLLAGGDSTAEAITRNRLTVSYDAGCVCVTLLSVLSHSLETDRCLLSASCLAARVLSDCCRVVIDDFHAQGADKATPHTCGKFHRQKHAIPLLEQNAKQRDGAAHVRPCRLVDNTRATKNKAAVNGSAAEQLWSHMKEKLQKNGHQMSKMNLGNFAGVLWLFAYRHNLLRRAHLLQRSGASAAAAGAQTQQQQPIPHSAAGAGLVPKAKRRRRR